MSGHILKKAFLSIGGDSLLRVMNRTPRVLFWHGVAKRVDPNVEQEIFDIDVFQHQIAYLNKHYEIISIEEFEDRLLKQQFSGREIVLTFDDGYANNLYVVAPILNKANLPYTVFVSAEHIETGQFFPTSVNRIITRGANLKEVSIPSKNLRFSMSTDSEKKRASDEISHLLKTLPVHEVKTITNELISNVSPSEWEELMQRYKSVRPMTWDEVKELSGCGATIGSHCMWHICCHENQEDKEVEFQLTESKKQIERHIGKECRYFAYPNGDYTEFSNNCVLKQYRLGFSTKGIISVLKNNKLAAVPRIGLPSVLDTFKIVMNLYPKIR